MTDERVDLRPRRGFWPVLLLLAVPAVLIGLNQLRKGGRTRVDVVGAGALGALVEGDAPESLRYALAVKANEDLAVTAERIEAALRLQPPVLVFGLDASSVADLERAEAVLAELMRKADSAAIISVSTGFSFPPGAAPEVVERANVLRERWRTELCPGRARVMCLDLLPHANDPAALAAAVRAATLDAVGRLTALRATTQGAR